MDIGTELCNSGECVICHCKDTHLTGDGGESCDLSRGMVQYHRFRILQLGYSAESCTIVLSIIHLDVVLSAYKDLLSMRYDIRELEVMLVPIRRRVYRFQLEKDEEAKT